MFSKRIHRMMGYAQGLTNLSSHAKYRFAAILVSGDRVIAQGVNKIAPKPRFINTYREGDMNRHSEVDCLMFIDKKTSKGCDIYVSGITRANKFAKSKPCPSCQEFLRKSGVKRVFYHDREGNVCRLKF